MPHQKDSILYMDRESEQIKNQINVIDLLSIVSI